MRYCRIHNREYLGGCDDCETPSPLYNQLCNIQARIRSVREDYRDNGFKMEGFECGLDARLNAIEAALGDVIAEMRGEK